ncbi:hypothetical protein L208DRAFT_860432 [Tricholoma matsutake]|nr:hypothetical protein L208DRAFT_860432 [Tricholoma matsutake 945]
MELRMNRVVHSSHFRAIFGSFSVFIFLPFFKNELENEIKNSKMIIFQKSNLPSLLQKWSFSLSFSTTINGDAPPSRLYQQLRHHLPSPLPHPLPHSLTPPTVANQPHWAQTTTGPR